MNDTQQNLPDSLDGAATQFSEFLRNNGYPGEVCWITADDVAVDPQGKFWLRDRSESRLRQAELLYRSGVERGLGIALRAVCANETTTFALIFIPRDETEAQYAMMGRGIKLSCPTIRRPTMVVNNLLWWWTLRARNRKRENILQI
jgi:hypothetical protein